MDKVERNSMFIDRYSQNFLFLSTPLMKSSMNPVCNMKNVRTPQTWPFELANLLLSQNCWIYWLLEYPTSLCYIHLNGISRYFGTNYKISYNMHYFAILSALISACAISFFFSNYGVSKFSFTNLWHRCKPIMFCQSCPITNGLVPLEIHSMFVSVWLRLWCICKIEEGLGGHQGHLLVAISTTPPLQDPPKANDAKSNYAT